MSVYVDAAVNPYGRMLMCHMLADTPYELHAMAEQLNVRSYFQRRASCPHYDIAKSKRAQAIALGAIELKTNREVAEVMKRIRPTWPRNLDGWL